MNPKSQFSNWIEVDLDKISANIHYLLEKTCVQVMAVVKGNAYGHGAVPVAQAALQAGASWLGVARLEEARELRRAGVEAPILLLGYTPPDRYPEAVAHHLSLTVWDAAQVEVARQAALQVGQPAHLHLKVDSGMSRLGVQPEQAFDLSWLLATTQGIVFEGIFTHYARADEPNSTATGTQESIFQQIIQTLESQGLRPALVHAANSAASLSRTGSYFNLIRSGIAIYGLHPSSECLLPSNFRPALAWKSVLSQVKTLPPGRGISYGHTYTTQKAERIGTIPVGYADGFRRIVNNQVLIHGQHVPVIGRVCMDQTMVQLDSVPEARAGDEVVLIGSQGDQTITAEQVAACWGTINYEVVSGIAARVPRIYL